VSEWLRGLQSEQAEMRQYEHSPLVEVQGWSEVPRSLPLFESFLNFLNYPVIDTEQEETGQLKVGSVRSVEMASYPLTVDASQGTEFTLEITSDGSLFDSAAVARMLELFELILVNMIMHADATLGELAATLDESERRQQQRKVQELKESQGQKLKKIMRRTHFDEN